MHDSLGYMYLLSEWSYYLLVTHQAETNSDPCIKMCPRVSAPLCDTNGQTHSNPCEFENKQCDDPTVEIAHDGQCTGMCHPCRWMIYL